MQEDPNATSEDFAQLKDRILGAKDGLISIKDSLDKAKGYESNEYTETSYEKLNDAIKVGESLLKDGSETEINSAIQDLNRAMDGLVSIKQLEEVEKAYAKVESSLDEEDLKIAKVLVAQLSDSDEKEKYEQKLHVLETIMNIEEEKEESESGTQPKDNEKTELSEEERKNGSELPKTASNMFNYLFIGILLLALGLDLYRLQT